VPSAYFLACEEGVDVGVGDANAATRTGPANADMRAMDPQAHQLVNQRV